MTLSDLPTNWRWVKIGGLFSFEYGKGLTEKNRDKSGSIPVYGSNGIVGYHSVPLVTRPCLIVGRKGAAGKVHLSKGACWPIDTTYYVFPPENIELKFAYYIFQTLNLEGLDKSTAIPGLNRNDAYALDIPLPPLDEQLRIVARIEELFTQLDAGVAALEAVRGQVRRYRQAVLQAGAEGDLTRSWRASRYGNSDSASIDGNLPIGWKSEKIGNLGKVIGGLTKNQKRNQFPLRVPYISVGNVYANELRLEEVEEIGIQESEIERILLKKGDLLVVEGNGSPDQIGRVAIWDGSINPCVHQNHIIKVRLDCPEMGRFIMLWLLSQPGREEIKQLASSTSGLYTLSISKVASIPIVLPPLEEQKEIVSEVERRFSIADQMEKSIDQSLRQAARLRQSILRRAFVGKLS